MCSYLSDPEELRQIAEEQRREAERSRLVVYRLWSGDVLLYVGVTSNLEPRLRTHRRRFGAKITNVTTVEYPTRAEAFAAERKAIAEEWTIANVAP